MRELVTALVSGALFGSGLCLSGMTQPQKVIGFLDFAGHWDPTLLFVMIGAIGVHAVAYRIISRRDRPLFADRFRLPTVTRADGRLIAGSALFGVGWGIGGYCPGPAITSLVTLEPRIFVFLTAMAIGMFIHEKAFGG